MISHTVFKLIDVAGRTGLDLTRKPLESWPVSLVNAEALKLTACSVATTLAMGRSHLEASTSLSRPAICICLYFF